MAGNIIHGREGALYITTSTGGATEKGKEIGYTNSWSVNMSRDLSEVSPLNVNSKEYVEGLVSGSISAEGSFRVKDTDGLDKIINRFASIKDSSTTVIAIKDGNIYMHLIVKPIDTAADTDNIKGAKFVAPILSNGFTVNVSGADISGWTYEGTINGDLNYYRSSDSDVLPKKVY